MPRRLQAWCETMAPADLLEPSVVALLKRFQVRLNLALFEHQVGADLERLLKTYHDEGLDVALWLLLPKDQGYWPNERNAADFHRYALRLLQWARSRQLPIPWVAVDLEPPIQQADRLLALRGKPLFFYWALLSTVRENRNPQRLRRGYARFERTLKLLHEHGARVQAAVFAYIVEDFVVGTNYFQDVTESPLVGLPWDAYSFMFYTTLLAREMPTFSRAEARAYAYICMKDACRILGPQAELSVGLTGSAGFLGEEPTYSDPDDLARDIACGAAAGVGTFAIYNLEGILKKRPSERWFAKALRVRAKAPRVPLKAILFRKLFQHIARRFGQKSLP